MPSRSVEWPKSGLTVAVSAVSDVVLEGQDGQKSRQHIRVGQVLRRGETRGADWKSKPERVMSSHADVVLDGVDHAAVRMSDKQKRKTVRSCVLGHPEACCQRIRWQQGARLGADGQVVGDGVVLLHTVFNEEAMANGVEADLQVRVRHARQEHQGRMTQYIVIDEGSADGVNGVAALIAVVDRRLNAKVSNRRRWWWGVRG
jgi:hypothetical protein